MHSVQSLISLGARVRVRGTTCPIMDVTGSPHQIVMIAYFRFVCALTTQSFFQPSLNILCAMNFYDQWICQIIYLKKFQIKSVYSPWNVQSKAQFQKAWYRCLARRCLACALPHATRAVPPCGLRRSQREKVTTRDNRCLVSWHAQARLLINYILDGTDTFQSIWFKIKTNTGEL